VDGEISESEALVRSAQVFDTASRDLAGLVSSLHDLAEAAALRELALGSRTEITSAAVRSVIAARSLRADYLDVPVGEPDWEILLEAFATRLEGRRIPIAGLAASAGLSSATAHDCVRRLIDRGLLVRLDDPPDGRSVSIGLADDGADRMRAYLLAAFRLSP
jgi:MarR family